ncbi:hypothetical protein OG711_25255 [Streptomyces uncialis]|uniref:hypothetical protein n=1 Tax=Streptomyces uncialis TaxID=1048205 RepID=UPI002E36E1E9|nr:hypothetical protein [Streptomyces uncialis]
MPQPRRVRRPPAARRVRQLFTGRSVRELPAGRRVPALPAGCRPFRGSPAGRGIRRLLAGAAAALALALALAPAPASALASELVLAPGAAPAASAGPAVSSGPHAAPARPWGPAHPPAPPYSAADSPYSAAVPVPPYPPAPVPGTPRAGTFPLTTRIEGAPDVYRPGAPPESWTLGLVNTTGTGYRGVHPVVVLVDEDRTLRPEQVRLEFHDGSGWRAARTTRTGRDETVGVFDGDGFTVPAHRTVPVRVRLAVTRDAAPGEVTATAALVQRRGDDGEWVGESGPYTFDVRTGPAAPATTTTGPPRASDPGTVRSGAPVTPGPLPRELAVTGAQATALVAAALTLVLGGIALYLAVRRFTPPRDHR